MSDQPTSDVRMRVDVEFMTRRGRIAIPDAFFYTRHLPLRVPMVGEALTLLGKDEPIEDGFKVVDVTHYFGADPGSSWESCLLILRLGGWRMPWATVPKLIRHHAKLGELLTKGVTDGIVEELTWEPLRQSDFRWRSRRFLYA